MKNIWRLTVLILLTLAACTFQSPAATPKPGATPPVTRNPLAPSLVPNAISTATLPPGMFANPVLDRDFPDPDSLRSGDCYYAYATNSNGIHVQVACSPDLVHWEMLGDALPKLPAWADQTFGFTWAPEVTTTADGKHFIMYYVTRCKVGDAGGRQCIAVATSDNAAGPFQPLGEGPLVFKVEEGGDIDPETFTEDDGTRYLVYKNDGNCCGGQTWIYIQKLSLDGLSLASQPTRLITADQAWEGELVEAPVLWKHNNKYYLFYSANDYTSPRYAVGYAVADHLLGPYTKPDKPILATNLKNGVIGPGGEDITVDRQGRTWMLYHAWSPGGYRNMSIDPLIWQGDVPVVAGPNRAPEPAP